LALSFMPSFRARIPSPSPLPSSGNFFGPKTSKAIAKIIIRCVGWNRPSNIATSREDTSTTAYTVLDGYREVKLLHQAVDLGWNIPLDFSDCYFLFFDMSFGLRVFALW